MNSISKVPPEYSAFSESVVSANHELVQATGELPMSSDNQHTWGSN
ncbi:carbonic anhydrase, gamma class [Vibrio sp. JCM 19052]|nr:carbonic anhydrase, gamma class [Vibrio sp. JCM 19052]